MSQQPDQPTTISEFFLRMARGRAQLEEWIATLGATRLNARGKDGWAIKDHLAHLAAWENGIAALLRGEARYAAMGLDLHQSSANDFEARNNQIYALHKDKPVEEVLNFFHSAHVGLQNELAKLSDADLQKPYSHFAPNEKRDDADKPIINWLIGNTYAHFEEHDGWIRENFGL